MMNQSLSPVFIGGTGRSGTTVLFRAVASSPVVLAAMPELRVHIDPRGVLNLIDALSDNWSPYQADIAIHDFLRLMGACRRSNKWSSRAATFLGRYLRFTPWRYPGVSMTSYFPAQEYDRLLKQFTENICESRSSAYWAGSPPLRFRPTFYETRPMLRHDVARIAGAFLRSLYRCIATDQHRYWCESSPYSILHADRLIEMFPKAKFLHVVRCPLDVAASYMRMAWGGTDCLTVCRRLSAVYRRWADVRAIIPDNSYLEVRIEDLAENPDQQLSCVAEFLHLHPAEHFDSKILQKQSVHSGRWMREISGQDKEVAVDILESAINEYGYRL